MSHCGLFILGMHRSGTSLAAGVARLAGIDLGQNLLRGKSGENPRGFWEHREVLAIDEAILSGLSLAWNVPTPLPVDWLDHPRVAALAERAAMTLHRDFATSTVWAIKDPRLCRLSPFWERAAAGVAGRLRAVHVYRHPLQVAASLAARNGMPAAQALELWLFHVVEAVAHWQGRGLVHVPLDRLVAEPLAVVDALRTLTGIDEPLPAAAARRIAGFVEPALLHRRAGPAAPDTWLARLARDCHAALERLALDPCDPASLDQLTAAQRQLAEAASVRREQRRPTTTIDVIMPVYRDREATLAAIDSVLTGGSDFELVVIDDASPDMALTAELRRRADLGEFTLLTQPANLGFVASANRGFGLHPDRDVVLLNSDTVVPPGWLDRLATTGRADFVGTVTPFSNNATIASYPIPLEVNPLPEGWTATEVDQVFREANAGWHIDLPTAVGFCMYIRRACLDEVGPFDEQQFGRGYGEENDFSLRAAAKGWRNVLAADLFVFHHGRASFGAEAVVLGTRATETIQRLHPGYASAVQRFLEDDPLAAAREAVDMARVERRGPAECRRVLAARRIHEANRLRASRDRIDELLVNVADLDRALGTAEALATERLTATRRLDHALGHAEQLAAERLGELERLTTALGTAEALATERLTATRRLDHALGHAEQLAAERLGELERLTTALGTAEALATERLELLADRDAQLQITAAALSATEQLAIERLAALESLDRQLRETATALAGVEQLARERLHRIEELTRQVEVFTAGLEQPPGRRRG